MKKMVVSICMALMVNTSYANAKEIDNVPVKPRIVGGQTAEQASWPWMSALVYTSEVISTSLEVDGKNYTSQAFTFGASGVAEGELVDCGIGEQVCSDVQNKVCLIKRGEINFSDKVNNCQAGGGAGAIIFNNVDGVINGTLGDDFAGTIPVVAITQADGNELLNQLGKIAKLSVSAEIGQLQDSICGASFLGDKWVLTAAHCVEDVNMNQLKVNVGEYDLSDGAENAINIKNIYIHPDYGDSNLNNDIALIELTASVNNEAITLVPMELVEQFALDESIATVVGWGGTTGYEPGGGPTSGAPDILRQVNLNLMTNQVCKQRMEDSFTADGQPQTVNITEAMICAGILDGGKGSCQGDSGGPLVVNTNEGWQQIGIVSWGFGCAAAGYPGVYTRASNFYDWLTAIYQGIAIEQIVDFGVVAASQEQTLLVEVNNNASNIANLTFSVVGSDKFTVSDQECRILEPQQSCSLSVSYSSNSAEKVEAMLIISSDDTEVLTSSAKLTGQTLLPSSTIETVIADNSELVNWFTGGDLGWQANSIDGGIQSGAIGNLAESIVMATVIGEGDFTFEWSVSSEENEDDPNDPFDALYLYIDNQLVDFISGEVAFEQRTFSLSEGEHRITWVYRKDPAVSNGEDRGFLRNITFSGEQSVTPLPVVPDVKPNNKKSGGGSTSWFILSLSLMFMIKRFIKN